MARLLRRGALPAAAFVLALGACGASKPLIPAKHHARLDDIPHVTGCSGYGHSGMASVGIPRNKAFLTTVCAALGHSAENLGVPGSSAQNTNTADVAAAPDDADTQFSFVWWGLNDLAAFGPSMPGFESSMRYLLSRLRSRVHDIHDFRDPAFRYTGGPWRSQPGQNVAMGDATVTWTSPKRFRGGVVAFTYFFTRGPSAHYAYSVDGRPAGQFDLSALTPPPPATTAVTGGAFRVRVPAGPGHVVRIALSNVAQGASIGGWELESPRPPLIVLLGQYRLSTYSAYAHTSPFVPTDAGVRALNGALAELSREYGSYMPLVNLDHVLGKKPALLFPDGLHPNQAGQAVIVKAIERVLAHNRHVRGFEPPDR